MIGTKRVHMSADEVYNHRSVDVGGSDDDLALVSRPFKKMKRRASVVGYEMFINILHANQKPQEETQDRELTKAIEVSVSSTELMPVSDEMNDYSSYPMISSPCHLRTMKRRLAFFRQKDDNIFDLDDVSGDDSPCESSPLTSESKFPPSLQEIPSSKSLMSSSTSGCDTPCVDVQVDKYGIPLAFRRNSNQHRQDFVQKRRASLDMITMDMDNIKIHARN